MKPNRLFVLVVVAVVAVFFGRSSASAADSYTMRLQTTRAGQIKGPMKSGLIKLLQFEFGCDAATELGGAARRKYAPLIIRKDLDVASPGILSAMVTNDQIKSLVIEANTPGAQPYTITLSNARFVSFRQLPDEKGYQYEEIGIAFTKISISIGGAVMEDEIVLP